jgi:preprotein translocase subunit SecB
MRCEFEVNVAALETGRTYEGNVEFAIGRAYPQPTVLEVRFALRAYRDAQEWPFQFTAEYLGRFEADAANIPALHAFAKYNAIAMLVPYARELASTITARAGFPAMLLGPVNVQELVDQADSQATAAG